MKNKRFSIIMLIGCLLLVGCRDSTKTVTSSSEENAELSTAAIHSSEHQTEYATTEESQKLSSRNMEDFEFSGYCFVETEGSRIFYRGEIVDDDVKKGLWNLICSQENASVVEGGTASICGNEIVLTDKKTGEVITMGYDIWYEDPYVEGGPILFIVNSSAGWKIYYHCSLSEGEEMLYELIKQGVVCEENIVEK